MLALLAAAYIPSALGCVYFHATLHPDSSLDVNMWDDINNNNQYDFLRDIVCSGADVPPYAQNSWRVPCTPADRQAELDINYNQDITQGGVLVQIYKRNDDQSTAADRSVLFTFLAKSVDNNGVNFQAQFACNDCTDSNGNPIKC